MLFLETHSWWHPGSACMVWAKADCNVLHRFACAHKRQWELIQRDQPLWYCIVILHTLFSILTSLVLVGQLYVSTLLAHLLKFCKRFGLCNLWQLIRKESRRDRGRERERERERYLVLHISTGYNKDSLAELVSYNCPSSLLY